FVGGGAEIAYWLELKAMFDHFKVPFPMLVLRNSFLLYSAEIEQKLKAMGIQVEELFLSEYELMNRYLEVHSDKSLDTNDEQGMANELFHGLKQKAGIIDQSLIQHLDALQTQLHKKLQEASKKMLRAEKRKYEVQKGQLLKIKAQLFPGGSLQERRENILPFYAQYGPACIDAIYQHSTSFWQQFILLSIED
ncbi:MAG: bacillithiol biosynthesis protein BshC, partial [Chitinophagaceae bacterium]